MARFGSFLLAIPEVVVIKIGVADAELEVSGVRAQAVMGETGLCIGVRGILPASGAQWLMRVCSVLAGSESAIDFALGLGEQEWVLWRAYGAVPDQFDAPVMARASVKLRAHVGFARYLERLGRKNERKLWASSGGLI